MQAVAMSNGYTTGKVYIIWEIPHDKINGYDIYRDGNLLVTSFNEVEDSDENKIDNELFVSPTMFDHDHQTNLFKKDSTFKLMYVDENVHKYQSYEYKVIAKRVNEEGTVLEEIESNTVTIQAQ